jgi:hypothetical protein
VFPSSGHTATPTDRLAASSPRSGKRCASACTTGGHAIDGVHVLHTGQCNKKLALALMVSVSRTQLRGAARLVAASITHGGPRVSLMV